jgi:ABC-type protease/lipase transport system fused ATPase/permease subunit
LKAHFVTQEVDTNNMQLPEPQGNLSVERLSYAFPGTEKPLLKGIDFELPAGETLALIGPSGSGKTTLIRLILGNLAANSGYARLDGMDLSQWPSSDRGQYIGYLPQDIELFAGTVRENIARMAESDPQAVVEAAQLADVHEMIMRLPKGYDTDIGPQGMALSAGQRQRLGLARALFGNPRLVVLDEPNSNLDQAGDAALARALNCLKERTVTTIIVSHRPAVLAQVDKVLLLQDGMVRAYGPREDVMKQPAPPNHLAAVRPMTSPKMTYRMQASDE